MSKSTTAVVHTVTAGDLRSYYRADEKRMARLSPEAQATVKEGAKGRVHAEAVVDHNKHRRTRKYVTGASKAQAAEAKAKAEAMRAAAAKAGLSVGKRGPLSKAAKAALAQSKG